MLWDQVEHSIGCFFSLGYLRASFGYLKVPFFFWGFSVWSDHTSPTIYTIKLKLPNWDATYRYWHRFYTLDFKLILIRFFINSFAHQVQYRYSNKTNQPMLLTGPFQLVNYYNIKIKICERAKLLNYYFYIYNQHSNFFYLVVYKNLNCL